MQHGRRDARWEHHVAMPWASVGDSVSCGLNEAPWVIGNPVTSDRQDFGASPLAAPPRGSRNQPSCLLILFAFRFGLIVVFLPTHKFSPYLTKSKPSPLKQDVTLRPCPNCSPINRVMSHSSGLVNICLIITLLNLP